MHRFKFLFLILHLTFINNINQTYAADDHNLKLRLEYIRSHILPSMIPIASSLYTDNEGMLTNAGLIENNKRLDAFFSLLESCDKDVILLVIAPGERGDQELPPFVHNAMYEGNKSFAILSLDGIYFINSGTTTNFIPKPFLNIDLELQYHSAANKVPIWVSHFNFLNFIPFSVVLPYEEKESIYTIFYNKLASILKNKLAEGRTVLVGNHASYAPSDMSGIYKVFNQQFEENWTHKFIFYTHFGLGNAYLHVNKVPNLEQGIRLKNQDADSYGFKVFPWDSFDPLKKN